MVFPASREATVTAVPRVGEVLPDLKECLEWRDRKDRLVPTDHLGRRDQPDPMDPRATGDRRVFPDPPDRWDLAESVVRRARGESLERPGKRDLRVLLDCKDHQDRLDREENGERKDHRANREHRV